MQAQENKGWSLERERGTPSGERRGAQSKGRRAQRAGTPLQSMGMCLNEYPTFKCCTEHGNKWSSKAWYPMQHPCFK